MMFTLIEEGQDMKPQAAKMARCALGLSVMNLARLSGVTAKIIRRIERDNFKDDQHNKLLLYFQKRGFRFNEQGLEYQTEQWREAECH